MRIPVSFLSRWSYGRLETRIRPQSSRSCLVRTNGRSRSRQAHRTAILPTRRQSSLSSGNNSRSLHLISTPNSVCGLLDPSTGMMLQSDEPIATFASSQIRGRTKSVVSCTSQTPRICSMYSGQQRHKSKKNSHSVRL